MARAVFVFIIVATLGWSAFWWGGARAVDRDIAGWLKERRDAGWVAEAGDVRVAGYPNRLDTTFTELELADPASGLAWSAPFFQLFRLSYQPRHVIAVWPEQQDLSWPGQRTAVTSADMRGSFVFGPRDAWPLERVNWTAEALGLVSDQGWTAAMTEARLALRPSERVRGAVDLGLHLVELRPASGALAGLAKAGLVPEFVERVSVEAAVTLDAALDRAALEDRRPQLTAVDLRRAEIVWGAMELWAAGEVKLDRQGRPSGSITLKLTNWREMLDLGIASGWVPEAMRGTLAGGLELLSGLAGSSQTLDAPLTFNSGRVSLGPITLGTMPPLKIR